jgi:hypothetical protein
MVKRKAVRTKAPARKVKARRIESCQGTTRSRPQNRAPTGIARVRDGGSDSARPEDADLIGRCGYNIALD